MFLNAFFVILSLLVLLGGLAPTGVAIDRTITTYKAGQPVWPWLTMSMLSFVILAVTAMLSLAGLLVGVFPSFIFSLNGGDLLPAVLASLFTLAGPWVVWFVGKRWIEQEVAP